ncbi:MAG TPA: beta-N-acetylhexosaminidase [Acidobacteriaceae bacterium]|nr:beta-N-acetylhexosaminidase [Acidobacteriaceae bacterium]
MRDLTRREFLHSVAGAAVGSTVISHDALLYSEVAAVSPAALGQGDAASDGTPLPFQSAIFPQPQEISSSGSNFLLDNQVRIVVPSDPLEQDLLLARLLVNELGDRFGLHLKIERLTDLSANGRVILIGSTRNPLVRQYCRETELTASSQNLRPEGYILRTNNNIVLVAGIDDRGAFYGLQSLRQLLVSVDNLPQFLGVQIRDWPDKPFRGIYMYLPGRNNIAFFKRFVRDFMALYKYNTLILEMNACMRLESHPELNYGWIQFARDANYSCRNYPPKPFHDMEQNSSHQDDADGGFLEKEEVADLARWVRQNHIDLIPALPSFTHSYYLLTEHRDLAAVPQNKWPDIYCPSNPKSYSLVFEVYDEYIDVLQPKSVHIGHDELFLPIGVSPQCNDKDIGELFGGDVKKIHDYLALRGIKTQLWGDMLLQSVRGYGPHKHVTSDGWTYYSPGGLTPEQVERLIPKDCLIYNWFWSDSWGKQGSAELNEAYLDKMGFQQVFGNFQPDIKNYETRKKPASLLGGAPSAWFATNENGFGKDLMSSFLGCSNILWTGQVIQGKALSARVQSMLPAIRVRLSGTTPPSQTETSIVPVDISSRFNAGATVPALEVHLDEMATDTIHYNNIPFDLRRTDRMRAIIVGTKGNEGTALPTIVTDIAIGEAPTSLIFLHASARRASNKESFRLIWDQQDTADLLGWYEVVYEDGFVITIPIRYGVNICEWNWDERVSAEDYCYNADALAIGNKTKNRITFFAYEWVNPRLGKVIQEIRLKGTTGFRGGSNEFDNSYGPIVASNAVILAALSMVRKRG